MIKVHTWEIVTLHTPTWCEYCGKLIRGIVKQAIQCSQCKQITHHDCEIDNLYCWTPEPTGVAHTFQLKTFSKPTWCNVCRSILHGLTEQGEQCVCCSLVKHKACVESSLSCKAQSQEGIQPVHHWIEGNVHYPKTDAMPSSCIICEEPLMMAKCLVDFHCIWCSSMCHSACLDSLDAGQACDLGILKELILNPTAFLNEETGEIDQERIVDSTPLLCFVNTRSGGQQGVHVLNQLKRHLNPAQVFDVIADGGPRKGLEKFSGLNCKILVCGGDGMCNWLLETLRAMDWNNRPKPSVAVLPLGTGNDLSRVLGWGPGYKKRQKVQPFLEKLLEAHPIQLDRWQLLVNGEAKQVFNNYFSLGVDASILHCFHTEREANPERFTSPKYNKLIYGKHTVASIGKEILAPGQVELWIDDEKLELGELQGILVVNVPSYAAGTDIWKRNPPQRFDDGLLEVVGIRGVLNLANVVVGPGNTIALGQGKRITIRLNTGITPVQVDGEPWLQEPDLLEIAHLEQANMLQFID